MLQLIFFNGGLNIYNDYYFLNQGYEFELTLFIIRYIAVISTAILFYLTYKHKGDDLLDYFERQKS